MPIPGVPLFEDYNEDEGPYPVIDTPLAQHHQLINNRFQDMVTDQLVHDGQVCKRMMFMFPPGSAKSTYGSVVDPTWVMGKFPGTDIILSGYADTICKRHGNRARQLCSSDEFRAIMDGVTLNPKTTAADNWALTNGSSYKASGVLSGVAGFRCHGLIWDDLLKGREAAESSTIRQKTIEAYKDDLRTRKIPNAWELGIGTRWHQEDHMGMLLPEQWDGESGFMVGQDGNLWHVLCVPAEADRPDDPLGREPGEMLWQEWFDEPYWAQFRQERRSWASLYQQKPSPEEGLIFEKDWFRYYTALPKDLNMYLFADLAVTDDLDNPQADYTEVFAVGVCPQGNLYVVDHWRKQCTMDVWLKQLVLMAGIHKPLRFVSEAGVIRRACEPFMRKYMRDNRVFWACDWVSRSADKVAMTRSLQAMLSAGMVYWPRVSWAEDTIDRFLKFPSTSDDHGVDAMANGCLYLEQLWAATPPKPKEAPFKADGDAIRIADIMPSRHKSPKQEQW